MNRLSQASQRIVSLVPSQTELLFDLGLTQEVVGITKFCTHPADKVAASTLIGGTKNVNINRVAALKPTLILANYEENTEADVQALRPIAPVHVTDVKTLSDALVMIRGVGGLVGRAAAADAMARQIGASFAANRLVGASTGPSVAYLIWRKPWMVAARDTFIDAMLAEAGFINAFSDPNWPNAQWVRYPVVTEADLQRARPDLLFLSSEPYPFREKHIGELAQYCPDADIQLVDGELFSWYGSRLLHAARYFAKLRSNLIG
ncbi:helical backbone metal receptor [Fibrella sp. ES10-3-2-2]|nr:cobalamin-binding protein [Fibrella sp. ES10-3-2-2]